MITIMLIVFFSAIAFAVTLSQGYVKTGLAFLTLFVVSLYLFTELTT